MKESVFFRIFRGKQNKLPNNNEQVKLKIKKKSKTQTGQKQRNDRQSRPLSSDKPKLIKWFPEFPTNFEERKKVLQLKKINCSVVKKISVQDEIL